MVQPAPGARVVPQLLLKTKEEASVPVTAMLLIVRGSTPVLVKVALCGVLATPTST